MHDVILEMLDEDAALDGAVKDAVLEALAEVVGQAEGEGDAPAAPTFLSSISALGFRGIGRQARLDLYPAPGLMVVSGRNGSGKSSFAEALELALTGNSYRWYQKKGVMWSESWRNLHQPDQCAIRVSFTAEGTGPFTVGLDWASDAALAERTSWTQVGSDKRVDGTDHLGWALPVELWRPVLSYDELGRLFDGGPSALYDALAKLLGLDDLSEAENGLPPNSSRPKPPVTAQTTNANVSSRSLPNPVTNAPSTPPPCCARRALPWTTCCPSPPGPMRRVA